MKANGSTTNNTDEAYITISTTIAMTAFGIVTSKKEKARCIIIMATFTLAIGKTTNATVKVLIPTLAEHLIKVIGSMIRNKVKVLLIGSMVQNMMVIGLIIRGMVMEPTIMPTAICMSENGKMTTSTEKESTNSKMVTSTKANI